MFVWSACLSAYVPPRLLPPLPACLMQVSWFVREGSALDLEARRRATTVYLTQKTVPMLPPLLCEQLCR